MLTRMPHNFDHKHKIIYHRSSIIADYTVIVALAVFSKPGGRVTASACTQVVVVHVFVVKIFLLCTGKS